MPETTQARAMNSSLSLARRAVPELPGIQLPAILAYPPRSGKFPRSRPRSVRPWFGTLSQPELLMAEIKTPRACPENVRGSALYRTPTLEHQGIAPRPLILLRKDAELLSSSGSRELMREERCPDVSLQEM